MESQNHRMVEFGRDFYEVGRDQESPGSILLLKYGHLELVA